MLEGLFDYAGMFPPAALSFEEALRESHQFPSALKRRELVGSDMVLTPENLAKLTPAALDALEWDRPCRVCLVGVGPDAVERHAAGEFPVPDERVEIVALEAVIASPEDVARLASPLAYAEPRWSHDEWLAHGPAYFSQLEEHGVGAKVRCAGPHALAAPTMAYVIENVADRRIRWKATQGLHHPLPGPDAYGFLGILTAVRLREARGHSFDEEAIMECITDEDPSHFRIDAPVWKGMLGAGATPFAVGSCSLREPDEDLSRW